MSKIITYTPNPALDINTSAPDIVPGKKIRCGNPSREAGGGGINVSRALKRLNCDSTAIYLKGGAIGKLYEKLLTNEGFNQNSIAIDENMRENISVYNEENGEMFRFVLPGAEPNEEEWKKLIEMLDDYNEAEFVVGSGSLPPGVPDDFYAQLSEKARGLNKKFILDTSKEPLKAILKSSAYLLKPNEKELNQLAEEELENIDDKKDAALQIIKDQDINIIVVSLGKDGAILAADGEVQCIESPKIENKKSAVGAGDSMVAGLIFQLSQGSSIDEAVKYGLSCGAAALLTEGTELIHKEDVEDLFKQFG